MRSLPCLLFVLACDAASGFSQDDAKNRPVTKVINLLKDMVGQLEKEAEEDEEVYEAMGCWCETNDKEKTKSIADAESRISDLTTAIEELTANSARLSTEIENLNQEVAKNDQALDSATALRKKQLAEFNEEEKDMLQSITSMKGAVVALSKHHEAALLQEQHSKSDRENAVMDAAALIEHQLHRHADLLAEVITPHQRKIATAFVQSLSEEEPSFLQLQQPQSGEIYGILKAMKESFEINLAQSQREETENQSAYEDLKAAKEEEIVAGQTQIDTKTTELANTDEKVAQSKQDLEDTRSSLDADNAFLASLKEQCQNVDQEYEERTKTRQLEIQAVSKALAFLSSDEAHDLFTRTFNFVQVSSESAQRSRAMKLLSTAGKKSGDPRLSALAVSSKIAAFGKVKKTIQDMVDALLVEKEDEIKHRDFCIEEFGQNERDTLSKKRDRADLEAQIDDLRMQIDALTVAIEKLKGEAAELQVQLKRAGQDREKQNTEFQKTVADQRATQKLLAAALNILKGFYDKAALLQKTAKHTQPAPPGFKSYEKNASSGGVMGMMQNIIDDAKALEGEALRGEEDSQKAYEDFVKDTNDSLDEKNKDITNKSSAKAKAEGRKVQAETEREGVMGEQDQLDQALIDLHQSCDYTMKNFELRQSTREDEIEALRQSIAVFSGASFGAFLQGKKR